MASLDEVRVAAYRIQQSGDELSMRLKAAANHLNQKRNELARVVGAQSRSGQEALSQVSTAERHVLDSAAQLLGLQWHIDELLTDLAN
ncbi:hypothetical protein [Granulicoccus sp. GXG6511]|uniref:hypothetical protein n=1 Tax=Granulicoccus sp. GXG6511 TaxID=3381351 RepID=UPI003D7E7A16